MADASSQQLALLKAEKLKRAYRVDPTAYARDVLKVAWWSKQEEIAKSVVANPKTMVRACHGIGKSHLGGGLVNWSYDCWDPGLTITTAPTEAQVVDVLWKEVRNQRHGRPGLQPKAPRMDSSGSHFAVGLTARSGDAFQGRHEQRVMIMMDEAIGVAPEFWDAAEGMMTTPECRWLCFLNPTDTASRAYEEELDGSWNVIQVSVLDHPNIQAELNGLPPVFPNAVRLPWLLDKLQRWCEPVATADKRAADIEFDGKWYRPGPLFEGRVLGRYPSTGSVSVWTDAIWQAALKPQAIKKHPLKIGCDVARFGDDFTSIVVRRGSCVLHHETHNGWATSQTAGRLKELAKRFAEPGEDPRFVDVFVDDSGVGGGVIDQANGWRFIGINSAEKATEPEGYPNRRSELWFTVAERADRGDLDLSRLSSESLKLLRQQALSATWKVDSAGRRVVEPKDQTKKRIKRSPDDLDALNLAFVSFEPAPLALAGPDIVIPSPWSRGTDPTARISGGSPFASGTSREDRLAAIRGGLRLG